MQTSERMILPLPGWILQIIVAAGLLYSVFFALHDFPTATRQLIIAFIAYSILLLFAPWLWMLVIPMALPILDLNLWSGRVYFSEFDFLVLLSAAIGLFRRERWVQGLCWSRRYWILLGIIVAWQLLTTLRGLLPLKEIDANSFVSLYSSYNSLRVAKGFLLTLVLIPLLGQSLSRKEASGKILVTGMVLGCLAGIAALFWERSLFTGIMNFSREYRATGFFSDTATGGAAVDAHLLLTLPFILVVYSFWRNTAVLFLVTLLGCLSLYAASITFSRANYPALGLSLIVYLGGVLYQNKQSFKDIAIRDYSRKGLLLLLIIPLVAYYFLSNPYIANRFSTTWDDLQTRINHWSTAIKLMNGQSYSSTLGVGKGSFPRNYYFSNPEEPAATVTHKKEANTSFFHFSKSDQSGTLFLRQRLDYSGDGPYRLKLGLRRAEKKHSRILVEFCERLVFQAYADCSWLGFNLKGQPGEWEELNKTITLKHLGKKYWYGSRPVEISILNRGINQPIDLGLVELYDPNGKQLIKNKDFSEGWDHWTFYSGDHLAWHVKNVFVYVFFEGGWVGLGIFLLLLFSLFIRLFSSIKTGSKLALGIASSLTGVMMVGQFDSLFDEPRITLLFFFLGWVTFSLKAPSFQQEQEVSGNGLFSRIQLWFGHQIKTGLGVGISVLNSKYRNTILYSFWGIVLIIFSLLAHHYFEQRYWMKAWNWIFTPNMEIPKVSLGPTSIHNPGKVYLDGVLQSNLAKALKGAKDGSIIEIHAGEYNEAAILNADNVQIIADNGVVIFGKAVKGKGALLIKGDNTYIEGIECHSIAVSDKNGACVRLEGKGLTLNRVYFHHSQTGLLGSPKGGDIVIMNSRFEDIGLGPRAHAIYIMGEVSSLKILQSSFLNTPKGGHEVKSRAKQTEIVSSIVGSTYSNDGRLVDAPNGGVLILKNNVFIEGPNSENADLFSWGVEGVKQTGNIIIKDNLIISDKSVANLISVKGKPESINIINNIVIGRIFGIDKDLNLTYKDRKAAGISAAPYIPRKEQLRNNPQ